MKQPTESIHAPDSPPAEPEEATCACKGTGKHYTFHSEESCGITPLPAAELPVEQSAASTIREDVDRLRAIPGAWRERKDLLADLQAIHEGRLHDVAPDPRPVHREPAELPGKELPPFPNDDELVRIAFEVFPDDPGFLRTVWKDGIDIQAPTVQYCELSLRLTKAVRDRLAAALQKIEELQHLYDESMRVVSALIIQKEQAQTRAELAESQLAERDRAIGEVVRCAAIWPDDLRMTCSRAMGHKENHFYQTDESRKYTGGSGVVHDSEYWILYLKKARQLGGLIVNDHTPSIELVAHLLQAEDARLTGGTA